MKHAILISQTLKKKEKQLLLVNWQISSPMSPWFIHCFLIKTKIPPRKVLSHVTLMCTSAAKWPQSRERWLLKVHPTSPLQGCPLSALHLTQMGTNRASSIWCLKSYHSEESVYGQTHQGQGWPGLYSVAHTEAILLGLACRVAKSSWLEEWSMLLILEFPLWSPWLLPTEEVEVADKGLFILSHICEILVHRFYF